MKMHLLCDGDELLHLAQVDHAPAGRGSVGHAVARHPVDVTRSERQSVATPPGSTASPTSQIISRRERPDGRLIARVGTRVDVDAPLRIVLVTTVH